MLIEAKIFLFLVAAAREAEAATVIHSLLESFEKIIKSLLQDYYWYKFTIQNRSSARVKDYVALLLSLKTSLHIRIKGGNIAKARSVVSYALHDK
jgi:hypothetical protein